MKKPIKLLSNFLLTLGFLALASFINVAHGQDKTGPCKVVGKGGVGESGAQGIVIHRPVEAKTEQLMVIRNVESSLCDNTGAIAIIVVNGEPVAQGVITKDKSSIQAPVKPGDTVIAIVHTIPLYNDIDCIRLGELNFTLEQCELVK